MLVLMLIEELADSHGGVLTRDQALRGGLTLRQVQHRVRAGRWITLHPGVYLVERRDGLVATTSTSRRARGQPWRGRVQVPWRAD
jgi:hypothetical protein